MRFDEMIHWSEGLFLQPHHLQLMQRSLGNLARAQRDLAMPFPYGFCDLELDADALKSRRIVVKRFSAVLPDGQEISMPGNCNVEPLTLEFKPGAASSQLIYLQLPRWSSQEPNLASGEGPKGRYMLHETSVADENSSDNEIPVMVRRLNAVLVTGDHRSENGVALPVCKVDWTVINSSMPSLSQNEDYLPPFIKVSKDCRLLAMAGELLFQLRSSRNSILGAFAAEGFDPKLAGAQSVLKILRLQTVNRYERRLNALLVPERLTPFELYLELDSLLADLDAQEPHDRFADVEPYNHDDPLPAFKSLFQRIRAILLKGGVSSALSFEFTRGDAPYLELRTDDERVFSSEDVFLAISFSGDLQSRVQDVETGDNFRLIDKNSFTDRVRGVKLAELRYPPSYLPLSPDTLWFKVLTGESQRIWKYISEDHCMIIDSARELFPNLQATLYVNAGGTD
jgi:type VI secretion system ImpJ/VasE family protein